jgi:hypothetical protein
MLTSNALGSTTGMTEFLRAVQRPGNRFTVLMLIVVSAARPIVVAAVNDNSRTMLLALAL